MPVKKQGTWPLYYLLLLYNVKLNPFPSFFFHTLRSYSYTTHLWHSFTCVWFFFFVQAVLAVVSVAFAFFCSFRYYFDDNFSCIDTFVWNMWMCARASSSCFVTISLVSILFMHNNIFTAVMKRNELKWNDKHGEWGWVNETKMETIVKWWSNQLLYALFYFICKNV